MPRAIHSRIISVNTGGRLIATPAQQKLGCRVLFRFSLCRRVDRRLQVGRVIHEKLRLGEKESAPINSTRSLKTCGETRTRRRPYRPMPRATTATTTRFAPRRSSNLAASFAVAPVVKMSSTSKTVRPEAPGIEDPEGAPQIGSPPRRGQLRLRPGPANFAEDMPANFGFQPGRQRPSQCLCRIVGPQNAMPPVPWHWDHQLHSRRRQLGGLPLPEQSGQRRGQHVPVGLLASQACVVQCVLVHSQANNPVEGEAVGVTVGAAVPGVEVGTGRRPAANAPILMHWRQQQTAIRAQRGIDAGGVGTRCRACHHRIGRTRRTRAERRSRSRPARLREPRFGISAPGC